MRTFRHIEKRLPFTIGLSQCRRSNKPATAAARFLTAMQFYQETGCIQADEITQEYLCCSDSLRMLNYY
jgi:hypothetical protein